MFGWSHHLVLAQRSARLESGPRQQLDVDYLPLFKYWVQECSDAIASSTRSQQLPSWTSSKVVTDILCLESSNADGLLKEILQFSVLCDDLGRPFVPHSYTIYLNGPGSTNDRSWKIEGSLSTSSQLHVQTCCSYVFRIRSSRGSNEFFSTASQNFSD